MKMSLQNQDIHTLYAFQYDDNSIEYSFGKIKNNSKKEIIKILFEKMTLERRWAFEACDAETSYDIVQCLLNVNGIAADKWFKD
jgi:hypothetical protein